MNNTVSKNKLKLVMYLYGHKSYTYRIVEVFCIQFGSEKIKTFDSNADYWTKISLPCAKFIKMTVKYGVI